MCRKFGPLVWLFVPTFLSAALSPGPARADILPSVEDEIIRLTNAERQNAGLPPLFTNDLMAGVAESYANLMTRFSPARLKADPHHLDGFDAGQRLANARYGPAGSFFWGENTAWNWPTARDAVSFWMNSPEHRKNLLSPNFTEIGVGVAYTAEGQIRYEQVFAGSPSGAPGLALGAGSFEGKNAHDKGEMAMSRFFARLSVPAVAVAFTFLSAAAPADALHDVKLFSDPTDIPLLTNTFLENTNAARVVVADVQQQTFKRGLPVGSPIIVSHELRPLEKLLIGHEHDSLDTTTFKIVGVRYKKD